jgi:hypothetical protein
MVKIVLLPARSAAGLGVQRAVVATIADRQILVAFVRLDGVAAVAVSRFTDTSADRTIGEFDADAPVVCARIIHMHIAQVAKRAATLVASIDHSSADDTAERLALLDDPIFDPPTDIVEKPTDVSQEHHEAAILVARRAFDKVRKQSIEAGFAAGPATTIAALARENAYWNGLARERNMDRNQW